MKCLNCGKEYPSRYYFVTQSLCRECFEKLDENEQNQILKEVENLSVEEATERSLDGHVLKCPVCGNNKFRKRKTLMNTPGLTFPGMEWTNKQADNYICNSCGYVYWFMREV